jgi:hypothetical protein
VRRPQLGRVQSPGSRSASRSNSFRGVPSDDESSKRALLKLNKYAERHDEGYDDVFATDPEERFSCTSIILLCKRFFKLIVLALAINSNSSDPLRLNVKRPNKAWRDGEDEDDDQQGDDPFADVSAGLEENFRAIYLRGKCQIEDSFTAFDVEANLLRDKHAMLCGKVNVIVDDLQPTSHEEALRAASLELVCNQVELSRGPHKVER